MVWLIGKKSKEEEWTRRNELGKNQVELVMKKKPLDNNSPTAKETDL